MNKQHCSECGQENPVEARFCMNCGLSLTGEPATRHPRSATEGKAEMAALYVPSPAHSTAPADPSRAKDTDWAAIAAAIVAFLSLRHLSRRARDTVLVIAFLTLFFGCPMICGFVAFVMQWFSNLFH
jgi:hypothetical protein